MCRLVEVHVVRCVGLVLLEIWLHELEFRFSEPSVFVFQLDWSQRVIWALAAEASERAHGDEGQASCALEHEEPQEEVYVALIWSSTSERCRSSRAQEIWKLLCNVTGGDSAVSHHVTSADRLQRN
jgi:hypothetical protein